MCFFEIGTLCVKVHVSINHVPLPPEINGRKQLTPHSLLNTFPKKPCLRFLTSAFVFLLLANGKMAILRVADILSRANFSPYKQFGSLIRVNSVKARQSEHTERCWIRQRDKRFLI